MYNFQIVKYYNTTSDIHKMNPLCKIICVLIFTLLVILIKNIYLLLLMLIFLFIMIKMSNVPLNLYLKNVKFLIPFILFIIVINLIFNIGAIITINNILKLVLLVMYTAILTYTTKPNDLTYGLESLFKPLKIFNIPVNELALSVSLAIRFIPIIFKEGEKVLRSQISRGLDFNGSLKDKSNKLVSVLLPIFTLSFKRADDIAEVLDIRLYNPNYRRYKKNTMTNIDDSILFMHILLIFIYVVVEVLLWDT